MNVESGERRVEMKKPAIPVPCSLFPVHYSCSLLPIPYCLFPVPCSLFPVPYSLILTHRA